MSREHATGIVRYQHLLTQSDVLNTFRYWSRQATIFEPSSGTDDEGFDALEAGEADVTRYRCRQDFVAHGPLVSRVVLCARALKRFPGLYDVHLRLVTLTGARRAVQSRLMLSGFSLENGLAVARRYLESVSWP